MFKYITTRQVKVNTLKEFQSFYENSMKNIIHNWHILVGYKKVKLFNICVIVKIEKTFVLQSLAIYNWGGTIKCRGRGMI